MTAAAPLARQRAVNAPASSSATAELRHTVKHDTGVTLNELTCRICGAPVRPSQGATINSTSSDTREVGALDAGKISLPICTDPASWAPGTSMLQTPDTDPFVIDALVHLLAFLTEAGD